MSEVEPRVGIETSLAKAFLVGFFILFFYTPTAQIGQSRVILTLFLAVVALALPIARLQRGAIALLIVGLAAGVEILASVVVNLGPRQAMAHALVTAFKPLYFALMYVFGYVCVASSTLKMNSVEVRRLFTALTSVFICTQIVLALMQAVGAAGVLDNLYSQEKTRDFSTIMRATGSMGNPNSLAFFTLQCFLFILLLGTAGWLWKTIVLVLGAILIALTGSRSVLIALMLCLVVFVFLRRKSLSAWIAYFLMSVFFFIAIVLVVQAYAEYFRYLSQLQLLLTTDSPLSKVNSMAARLRHWETSLALFDNHAGIAKYLFGLGDRNEYGVLDNDYLYIALRHGALGVVLFYGWYMLLATRYLDKSIDGGTRFFGMIVLFAAIVLSFAGEFFANWHHMVFFIVLTGALSAARSPVTWLNRGR